MVGEYRRDPLKEEDSPSKTINKIMNRYKDKIRGGVLPPDPARVLKVFPFDFGADIEHVLPVPPIIETIHSELLVPLVEKMPRFPMTAEFAFRRWLEWKQEKID